MDFAVVVDSTCDFLPQEYLEGQIAMVPLTIGIDDDEFKDQIEITSEGFYERMAASEGLPRTSQPSPYDFVKTYERLAAQGFEHIVSLHLAAPLSGTVESARVAASQVAVDVRVIDSCSASAGLGLVAQEACRLRDAGVSIDEAETVLRRAVELSQFVIAPETLENLLKGGRLSPDQVKTASMLNIKPIFSFNETGVLVAAGKAKGMRGVIKEFARMVAQRTEEEGTLRVRFCYTGDGSESVDELKAALAAEGVSYVDGGTCPCGATVATHLGLGVLGVGTIPAALS